jgi:hypothetical protein
MPITRIPYPNALPVEKQDFVKQNNLLETGFLRVNDPWPVVGGNITKGAIFQFGGTVYLATSDTAIAGVASDYVKLTPNGDGSELSPSYVANLAGVSWNQAYNGYYDVGGNLYVFDESIALNAGEILVVYGKIAVMIQSLLALGLTFTGNNTFTGLINVDNEVHSINDFGALFHSATDGSYLFAGAPIVLPEGFYIFGYDTAHADYQIHLEINISGTWRAAGWYIADTRPIGIMVYSDGVNMRLNGSGTVYYKRYNLT